MAYSSPTTSPIIIQGGQVLLPSGEIEPREVAIADGKITAVGTHLEVPSHTKTIDATGLTLLPGVIDSHVHFCEPGSEHKEDLFTGTCACAKGGVTSFLEMPNTLSLRTTQASLTGKLAIAAAKSLVNYGFFMGAMVDNYAGLPDDNPTCGITITMDSAVMDSAHGPRSIDPTETIEPIFAAGVGAASLHETRPVTVQTETPAQSLQHRQQFASKRNPATSVQDDGVAPVVTAMALELSKKYQRRLHILHMSTGEEAELLRRDKPSWVTAEVTPQHLLLDVSAYEKIGPLAQMNPPLQSPRDRELLWQALLDGVIDFIATDHNPHTLEEKSSGYPHTPSGIPGVETSLPLMLTQAKESRCTVAQVSHWMSTAVAQAYNIPNKGLIEPGYDADIVLVDLTTYRPVLREELKTKCGWSPFEGWNLTGWPVVTLVGGEVVYDHGQLDVTVRGQALKFDVLI